MRRRRTAAALAVPLLLSAACSGDDDKPAKSDASAPSEVTALVATLRSGVNRLTSSHFTLTATLNGQRLAGAGDETLADGKLTGLDADATVPGLGSVSIVVVGAKRYVKLPPPLATTAKPWLPITASSDNLVVTQARGILDAALTGASLDGLTDLAGATTSVRKLGTSGGNTRYALTIDPAKLPTNPEAKAALGKKKIPAQLTVDRAGRPVKVQVKVALLGQPTDTTVEFSKFNAPVSITPPPAGQIASE